MYTIQQIHKKATNKFQMKNKCSFFQTEVLFMSLQNATLERVENVSTSLCPRHVRTQQRDVRLSARARGMKEIVNKTVFVARTPDGIHRDTAFSSAATFNRDTSHFNALPNTVFAKSCANRYCKYPSTDCEFRVIKA